MKNEKRDENDDDDLIRSFIQIYITMYMPLLCNLSNAIDRIGWTINSHIEISNQIVRMQMQLYIFCGPFMSPNVFMNYPLLKGLGDFARIRPEIHLLASAIFLMIGCFVLELQGHRHKF